MKVVFLIALFLGASIALAAAKDVAPGVPGDLKLVIVPKGFKLSWTPSADDPGSVTGYEIVRAGMASGPFVTVGKVAKGVLEYVDTTAAREVIHYYKVRAVAGKAYSHDSNIVTGER